MSGRALAALLRRAMPHYPVSDAYEREHLPGPHWWTSQQEHVTAWLGEIDGPGAFGRKQRGLGARHAYNHFQCAPGLLWIAEALGEDTTLVNRAASDAAGKGRPATQCAVIRRHIPWGRIVALIDNVSRGPGRRSARLRDFKPPPSSAPRGDRR